MAAMLAGCLLGSGGGGQGFEEGHYLLANRFDQSYAYKQYFVALPDHRFEWVEYGYNASNSQVCKVTRKSGEYALADSSVEVTVTAEAAPVVKCGFSKEDFKAMKLVPREKTEPVRSDIRNRTDKEFEAKGFFGTGIGLESHSPRGGSLRLL